MSIPYLENAVLTIALRGALIVSTPSLESAVLTKSMSASSGSVNSLLKVFQALNSPSGDTFKYDDNFNHRNSGMTLKFNVNLFCGAIYQNQINLSMKRRFENTKKWLDRMVIYSITIPINE